MSNETQRIKIEIAKNNKDFQLLENGVVVVKGQKPKWYSSEIQFRYNNKTYNIKKKGFWGTSFSILQGGQLFGDIVWSFKKGAKINYFDPNGEKSDFKKFKSVIFSNNIKDAIKKSDLIIIHTEWNDFKTINFKKDVKNKKFSIFDMRNIYSVNKMKDQKIKYFSIGN